MWGNAMQLCINGSMPPACHAGSSVCLHLVDHLRTRITIPMLIDSATVHGVCVSLIQSGFKTFTSPEDYGDKVMGKIREFNAAQRRHVQTSVAIGVYMVHQ